MAWITNQSTVMQPSRSNVIFGDVEYCIANQEHDHALRELLHNNSIPGWVTLSYEREPNYFLATTIEGDIHDTVIGIDKNSNKIKGTCTRSIQKRYVNGEVMNLGYIGGLRVSNDLRNKIRPLKNGFRYYHEYLHNDGLSPFYLTSIISDNIRAKRILTASLPGFPTYRKVDTFHTLAFKSRNYSTKKQDRHYSIEQATTSHLAEMVDCLNRNNARYQYSTYWTKDDLLSGTRCRGLSIDNYYIAVADSKIIGCLAYWDQSKFKQTVVRDYYPSLKYTRPLANITAKSLGYPTFPAIGNNINQAFLSHMAIDNDNPEILEDLIKTASHHHSANDSFLVLGLSHRNPMLPSVKKQFKHMTYTSDIYQVHWEDGKDLANSIDTRPVHIDIASL